MKYYCGDCKNYIDIAFIEKSSQMDNNIFDSITIVLNCGHRIFMEII